MTSPFLTVPEVAGVLRCHEKTVRRMIRRGDLRGEFIAGRWLVRERDVPGLAPRRRPGPGAPRRTDGATMDLVRQLEAEERREAAA